MFVSSAGDWREVALDQVCRIAIGGTPSRAVPRYWSDAVEGYPWTSIADLKSSRILETKEYISKDGVENSNVKLVPRGTVVMSFKLTIGRTAIADRDLYTNEAIAAFTPKEGLDRDFLFYWLPYLAESAETDQAIKGATLNKEKLLAMSGLLPPLDEQRRIADVLRSVDESIAATQNIIEHKGNLWQNLAEALVWEYGAAGLRPLGAALIRSDYGVNVPLNTEGLGKPVLRMGNIQDGKIDLAAVKWGIIPDKEAQALKLVEGDILFNRTNSRDLVGKVALVREPTDCLYASYIVRLAIDKTVADPYYLFAVMHSDRAQFTFKSIATPGVSQSNINPTNLKKQLVPLPSLSKQKAIAEYLKAIEFSRMCAMRELETLGVIKQDIASALLSGQVRVPA